MAKSKEIFLKFRPNLHKQTLRSQKTRKPRMRSNQQDTNLNTVKIERQRTSHIFNNIDVSCRKENYRRNRYS